MATKSVIEAKFRRAKLKAKKTQLWSGINEESQENLIKMLHLLSDDDPIIFYQKSPNYCWLLSMNCLIVFDKQKINRYPYSLISKVALPDFSNSESNKVENEKIIIQLVDNTSLSLFTEIGTWHFIYQLFKFLD